MIDIIIPVLNEEKILKESEKYYRNLSRKAKVIFVDGGSKDRTISIAEKYGDVILSPAGRGIQKNRGSQKATSDFILFLHVDSFLSDHALEHIEKKLQEGSMGGCLTMQIQDKRFIFRIYEKVVNFRAKVLGVIDGDLGMFVRKDIFTRLNGFDQIPVMEDLVFAQKLCAIGPISVLSDPIFVSSRKWRDRGFIRTFMDYTSAHVQLWFGRLKSKCNFYEVRSASQKNFS